MKETKDLNSLRDQIIKQSSELNFKVGDASMRSYYSKDEWTPSQAARGAYTKELDIYGDSSSFSLMQCYYTAGTQIDELRMNYRCMIVVIHGCIMHNNRLYKTNQTIVSEPDMAQSLHALEDTHLIVKLEPKLKTV